MSKEKRDKTYSQRIVTIQTKRSFISDIDSQIEINCKKVFYQLSVILTGNDIWIRRIENLKDLSANNYWSIT